MSEIKCPKCGSTNIDQYRMPTGAIWCGDCGFRVEQKETGNPFIDEQPKPAPVQSAENFSAEIGIKFTEYAKQIMDVDPMGIVITRVKNRDAAQRQAGREEAERGARNVLETYLVPLGLENKPRALHDLVFVVTGRLEMKISTLEEHFAAVVEAARKRIAVSCVTCGYKGHCGGCAYAEIRKALSDLDEARNG